MATTLQLLKNEIAHPNNQDIPLGVLRDSIDELITRLSQEGGGELPEGAVNLFTFDTIGDADDDLGSNGDVAIIIDTGDIIQKSGGTWAP